MSRSTPVRDVAAPATRKPSAPPKQKATAKRPLTSAKAPTRKRKAPKLPRIFVSIASYRDTECQWTIKDLFDKATHPDRVFVGVCWQFFKDQDADCFEVVTRPEQCRVIEVDASESRGVGWARSQVQSLWAGEEYFFQIDAHSRFEPGWDELCLQMLAACPSPRPVLSAYPTSYVPPDQLGPRNVVLILPKEFDDRGLLAFTSVATPEAKAPALPTPTAYVAGGLLFAPSAVITEVPYDPYIYFTGEEIAEVVATAQARAETLADRVDTFSRTFLGLTVACARCHDHKFDPITARDYYALAGIFDNSKVELTSIAPREVVNAFDAAQKAIKDHEKLINAAGTNAATKSQEAPLKAELERLKKTAPPAYAKAHLLVDRGNKDMPVAIRGDLRKPGEPAPRRFLQIVAGENPPLFKDGSGRRQLADAVTAPANALTVRVIVNRVWQQHFGTGFVPTPDDLGNMFQFQAILGDEFQGYRDAARSRALYPGLLDFDAWLAQNASAITVA
jgi:hypothetical protein